MKEPLGRNRLDAEPSRLSKGVQPKLAQVPSPLARAILVATLVSALLVLQFPQFMTGTAAIFTMLGLLGLGWLFWPRLWLLYGPLAALVLVMAVSALWVDNVSYGLMATAGAAVVIATGLAVGRGLSLQTVLEVTNRTTVVIGGGSIALAILVPQYALHSGPAYSGTLIGIYISKNSLAVVMLFGAVATLFRTWPKGKGLRRAAGSFAVYGTVFWLTQSATTIAILGACLLLRWLYGVWIRASSRSRAAGFALALGPALAIALFGWSIYTGILTALDRDVTLTGRTAIWEAALSAWRTRPWTGIGWGGFETDSLVGAIQVASYGWVRNHAHSGFVQVLVELGIIGIAVLGFALVATLWQIARTIRSRPTLANGWLLAVFLTFVAHNVTEQSMRLLPLFMLALAYGACTQQREQLSKRGKNPARVSRHSVDAV